MISYNSETKRLIATFKRYRNDIDIFTEDEKKDLEFYKVLFKRLLEDTDIKINDITTLGCRNKVIERCKNEPSNGKHKIFIVDGDIFLINQLETEQLDNLFILDSYCIENYLICQNASTKFAYNLIGTKSIEKVREQLDFDNWLDNLVEPLIELFFHFSILHEVIGKFRLFNAYKYIKKGTLNIGLVNLEIESIKSEIFEVINEEEYINLYKKREEKWLKNTDTLLRIVSGKDYLLPLLQIQIQNVRKTKGLFTNESIKLFLAQFCSLNRLENLKERIMNLN